MALPSELMGHSMVAPLARDLGSNAKIIQDEADLINANSKGQNAILYRPITLRANLAFTGELAFLKGGSIITNGFTLTVSGPLAAGAYQIFNTSLGGSVVFSNGKVCTEMLAEWWGATGDGTTDDTTAWQAAINAARINPAINAGNIPIRALVERTYLINSLYLPAFTIIKGPQVRKSSAVFKCNTTSATMFVVDGGDRYSDFICLEGLRFDPNGKATTCLSIESAGNMLISDCHFHNDTSLTAVTNHILLGADAIWCWIQRCTIDGKYTYGVHLTGGNCNQNTIRDCHFSGSTCTHAIYSDSSWAGDTLIIDNCAMETGGTTDMINLDRASSGGLPVSQGCIATIVRCRFDRACVNSHIKIQRYTWGVKIYDCRMVDPVAYNIDSDAYYTFVADCHLGNATSYPVRLRINSARCHVRFNEWNPYSGGQVLDEGGDHTNTIERKTIVDTTANRPANMQQCEQGHLYMDNTLAADGQPIWWNGVAWVDSNGTVV
ncbi:MAG TPA: right-handed parallel beta-helix repeat-containing protein [bacterium]|nr:right-handed parallel beta-helix repeat-containing protein [bacterium]